MVPDPVRAAELFDRALDFEPSERGAFLAGACGNDVNLRRRVEDLLLAHEAKSGFLPQESVQPEGRESDLPQPLTMSMATPLTEGAGTLIDRYKLLEKLGEGGFGAVWAAEQREPVKRRVALKIIKLGMDTGQVVARFEAERQALALMDHPNIAKVLDAGSTDTGRPYFVMELVRGIPITKYCDQEKLATGDRLDLFMKVCHAIQHAHQKGIIHRDIKPSNILVTLHDGVPVPKVIDFGIAKATQGELTDKTIYTHFAQFIGTPAYMSPEQAEMSGLDIDTRSDIYSLGVLLYELLTGTTPFDSKELMRSGLDEMRKIIREKEPLRPSSRLTHELTTQKEASGKHATIRIPNSAIDRDLDWIVMKCLEKDRARRYETANGLAADLKRHVNNEPVVARPPSAGYRLQKVWQRNRLALSAAAAVAAALVLATVVSLWQAARATRASTTARKAQAAEAVQRIAAEDAKEPAEGQRERAERAQARADAERETAQRHLYAAKLNLLQQAWEQNNLGRVRELVNDTASYPERDFEWYYWQRQTRLARQTLHGHLDRVDAVAFSPDGRTIVSAGGDQLVKVWDADSGRELMSLSGHSGLIFSLSFSPDGQQFVTGSWDHTAKVWDATSGRLLKSLHGHRSAVWSVAYSSNGLIATGSSDGTVILWTAADFTQKLTITDHESAVTSVDFSPDGQRLVTVSRDETVRIWNTGSGEELFRLPVSGRSVRAEFSPDDRHIVTLQLSEQTAIMWDASDGRKLNTFSGHGSGLLLAVAFSRDGSRIVTGSDDNTAKVWNAENGQELLTLKGHSGSIRAVDFSQDGRFIVTASHDRTLKVWVADPESNGLTIAGHSGPIRSVAFSQDGRRIATGSEDRTAVVWDSQSGQQEFVLRGHKDWISSVGFSPDGQYIATGSEDQTARISSAVTGGELHTLSGHAAGVLCVAFSPDSRLLVTGSWDHSAIVWDLAGDKRPLILVGHTGPVWSVAFSPDSQWIATGSEDDTVRTWDAVSGQPVHVFEGHTAAVRSVQYSVDARWIVTGSVDSTARIWKAASGTQDNMILRGHTGPIWSVGFSRNGRRIVTGSADGTVRVWDAASGNPLLKLSTLTRDVLSAAFSPDGLSILGGSADKTAALWEAVSAEQLAIWQEKERRETERMADVRRAAAAQAKTEQAHRAGDPGAIRQWLILAPIQIPTLEGLERATSVQGMQQPHVPIEKHDFLPRNGDRVLIGDRELIWREAEFRDYVIPFDTFLGEGTYWPSCLGYAVCYVHSQTERQGLTMKVGWDDYAKVYLNGVEVFQSEQGPFARDAAAVEGVSLNAGRNVLVFKVANGIGPWRGSIRLEDSAGSPVEGIHVTLDPAENDLPEASRHREIGLPGLNQ